ncbi:MAG: DUF1080 domain-containing protein [Verrucomicrobia bacterium]|nr:DUF1080 domain-containing protein [Verrucomicrobiota bacterium]
MKLRLALLSLATAAAAFAADAGFKPLFNGKDLSGWKGLDFWSVKNGTIVGQTTAEKPTKGNTFLVYQDAQPANFELKVQFRLTGQNEKKWGNSGVQYRSKVVDAAAFVVAGYQADIDSDGRYAGMLYEEKGRGILMGPGEKIKIGATTQVEDTKKKGGKRSSTAVEKLPGATPPAEILAAYKLGEWNELRVVAKGNHVQHFLNGKLSADVTDNDPERAPKSGVIALQLHQGPPMTIEFKDVRLKTLP